MSNSYIRSKTETSAAVVKCRVVTVKRLSVLHHSADYMYNVISFDAGVNCGVAALKRLPVLYLSADDIFFSLQPVLSAVWGP